MRQTLSHGRAETGRLPRSGAEYLVFTIRNMLFGPTVVPVGSSAGGLYAFSTHRVRVWSDLFSL